MKQLFSKFLVAFLLTSAVVLSWSEYFFSKEREFILFCIVNSMKNDKFSLHSVEFRIFLPLRFYVKSILVNREGKKYSDQLSTTALVRRNATKNLEKDASFLVNFISSDQLHKIYFIGSIESH